MSTNKHRLFIAAFICVYLCVSVALAAPAYKPGSVGYLYQDCQQALETSTKFSELQETYCGAFTEGYAWGAMALNWGEFVAAKDDPCGEELSREYERINNRGCGNLPKIDPDKESLGAMLSAASDIVARWIAFEKARSKSDPLKRKAMKEVNNIIIPGPFCEKLGTNDPALETEFTINPALQKMALNDFLKTKKNLTIGAKIEQCRKDIEVAAGDEAKFSVTRCGAEINGYISGLHSTQHLQKNRSKPSTQCAKRIERLYNGLDTTKSMCVTYKTSPLQVAEIFLKQYADGKQAREEAKGGVGYQVIYKGFLCAAERSKAD